MLSPLSPTVAASATGEKHTDTDGLHFRGGQQQTRTRKASLSDSVPVEVIGEVDRGEPFKEATKDLNTEMKKKIRSEKMCQSLIKDVWTKNLLLRGYRWDKKSQM